jgi:hypothetical protein
MTQSLSRLLLVQLTIILFAITTSAWRRSGATIELYPAERAHPLLDTRISSLRINNVKVNEALQHLLSSVEVKQALLNFGLRLVPTVPRDDYPDSSFSISADNITLRQALNQLAESSGTRFWAFELIGPNRGAVWIRLGAVAQ